MAEKIITIAETITVGELADKLNLSVSVLVGELFKNGIVATINQKIDIETATIILEELGIENVQIKKKTVKEVIKGCRSNRQLSDACQPRPPIVAMMGHVDHGKTSLLDAVLGTKVTDAEAGGITQHISAYQTTLDKRTITFLDTPGHEAFASLRQHGAILTDAVVIVVAADDGVKPQTVEAIKFARSAKARIIVAINKVDKDTADVPRVKTQLADSCGLNPEEWGGDTVMVEVSAKTGQGIDKLLEMILLVTDLDELKADVDVPAEGLVIEAHMSKGRGAVVKLLIENGTLKTGDFLVAGSSYGKVKTLQDFLKNKISQAGPSTPVTITGFKHLPYFGDVFFVVASEKEAKKKSLQAKIDEEKNLASTNITSDDMLKLMSRKDSLTDFNVIVKADVQGSLTSVIDCLRLIDTKDEVAVQVVGSGVGDVTENDIMLASDKKTVIYGFNVKISNQVRQLADRHNIQVRLFDVIYQLLDDATQSIEDLLEPEIVETAVGELDIKAVFRITRDEAIVGGLVKTGKIFSGLNARVYRKKEKIADVVVTNVQKEKNEVKEAFENDLCGLGLKTHGKISLEEGDRLEIFSREVIRKKL